MTARQYLDCSNMFDTGEVSYVTHNVINLELNNMEEYVNKMSEARAKKIDDGVFLALRPKPWWLPKFIWYRLIKMLIKINYFI